MLSKAQTVQLIEAAGKMREKAYAPYSQFRVGAALLTEDGQIYGGCNIENAAYTPTICAERTAFFKAVSEGQRKFCAIAIVGGRGEQPSGYAAPCGVCRQVMAEFCRPSEFVVIMAQDREHYRCRTLEELLPCSFGPDNL